MLHKTPGIVLHTFKYGDSGIIARVLTRDLGLQSYLVQGGRRSKSPIKASLFQHLNLVDMVVYYKEKPGLQRIKEVQSTTPLNSTLHDIRKTSLALFLSEFLLNAFKNQEAHPETFDFVLNVVKKLDELDRNLGVFHIVFMLQLSKYLGFAPSRNFSATNCFFNLREGIYQKQYDNGLECLDQEESIYFSRLSSIEILEPFELKISIAMRNKLLGKCINYYRMHMDGFGELKSVEVLEEVFR